MKIEKMFKRCQEKCYDPETGWSYNGHTGGNAVSKFFDDKYNINLAAGWNTQKHDLVCDLMSQIED